MSGPNQRHYDRCDQGGSIEARPDEKMGNLRRWPAWESPFIKGRTSGTAKVLKNGMSKKRRQRDRTCSFTEDRL